ncbi:MAG: oligosaccharide flippase family protein [Pirellulaceae bacterium]
MTDPPQQSNHDEISGEQLLVAVRGGTRKVVVAQVFSQLVSLATLGVLYRWISPDAFGLLSMATPLVLLPRMLTSLGLSIATVQRETLSDQQRAALFSINIVLGLVAAAATVGLGYLFAPIYGATELITLCQWLAGTSVLASLGFLHQALLERKMQLGRLVAARLGGQTAGSLLAIIAVILNPQWGVWILVLQQYVELTVINIAVWCLEPWKPRWPRRQTPLRDLMHFGGLYSASSLLFYLGQAIDKMLIAWWFGGTKLGQAGLGIYSQSFLLVMKPVQLITQPVTSVMLPALSRAQSDPQAYQQIALLFYRMIAITLLPAGVGLFVVGRDVMLVLAPEWKEAGWLVTALAPAILAQGFVNITGSVLASVGKTKALFFSALVMFLLLLEGYLAGYWLGTKFGDPATYPRGVFLGVAASYSLVMLTAILIPYLAYSCHLVGIRLRDLLALVWHPGLASLAMGLVVWALGDLLLVSMAPWLRLVILIPAGVILYLAFALNDVKWLAVQLAGSPEPAAPEQQSLLDS